MKKKVVTVILAALMVQTMCQLVFADDDSSGGTTKGAPPAEFKISIQDGDDTEESDRYYITSVTGNQMRLWAQKDTLKYSGASFYGNTAGRIVREWITLEDFVGYISDSTGVPIEYESGDYFIMGEDLTKDEELVSGGYDRAILTGNWYSYDLMIGTTRYYFPNWSSGSEEGAVEVPSIIAIRSYGGSNGMTDETLDIYAGSCDYLWAYVVNYGQTTYTEENYPYFYYGQEEAAFRYKKDSLMNDTIKSLLQTKVDAAKELLDKTQTGTTASEVPTGTYWVTEDEYNALSSVYSAAADIISQEDSTNGAGFDCLEALDSAITTFESARKAGSKAGYYWYDPDAQSYTIISADQLWEFCTIVNGEAYDEESLVSIDQDSFEGKTVYLAGDIDAGYSRVHIGTEEYPFEGTFDGQGHTISNLKITFSKDVYKTSGYYTALFGNIGSVSQTEVQMIKTAAGRK